MPLSGMHPCIVTMLALAHSATPVRPRCLVELSVCVMTELLSPRSCTGVRSRGRDRCRPVRCVQRRLGSRVQGDLPARVLLAVLGGIKLRVHAMRRTDAQARAQARPLRMSSVRWRRTGSVWPNARRVLHRICCRPARRPLLTAR